MTHVPPRDDTTAQAGEVIAAAEKPGDPWLARAIILRGWLECAPPAAWAYYTRHAAILRDPRAIAMLCWLARETHDPVETAALHIRFEWLLRQRRE